MKTGIELIAEERKEQIEKHNRSINTDKINNKDGQLLDGALTIASSHQGCGSHLDPPKGWNEDLYNKMINKSYKERLIIAGALIAAEIDRIEFSHKIITMYKKQFIESDDGNNGKILLAECPNCGDSVVYNDGCVKCDVIIEFKE